MWITSPSSSVIPSRLPHLKIFKIMCRKISIALLLGWLTQHPFFLSAFSTKPSGSSSRLFLCSSPPLRVRISPPPQNPHMYVKDLYKLMCFHLLQIGIFTHCLFRVPPSDSIFPLITFILLSSKIINYLISYLPSSRHCGVASRSPPAPGVSHRCVSGHSDSFSSSCRRICDECSKDQAID